MKIHLYRKFQHHQDDEQQSRKENCHLRSRSTFSSTSSLLPKKEELIKYYKNMLALSQGRDNGNNDESATNKESSRRRHQQQEKFQQRVLPASSLLSTPSKANRRNNHNDSLPLNEDGTYRLFLGYYGGNNESDDDNNNDNSSSSFLNDCCSFDEAAGIMSPPPMLVPSPTKLSAMKQQDKRVVIVEDHHDHDEDEENPFYLPPLLFGSEPTEEVEGDRDSQDRRGQASHQHRSHHHHNVQSGVYSNNKDHSCDDYNNVALIVSVDSMAEASIIFDKLSSGYSTSIVGSTGSFSSSASTIHYGTCIDPFGMEWIVTYAASSTLTGGAVVPNNTTGGAVVAADVSLYRYYPNGNCLQAFEFYQKVFSNDAGSDSNKRSSNQDFIWKTTWDDAPDNIVLNPKDCRDKIMHISLQLTSDFILMGCDVVPLKQGVICHCSSNTGGGGGSGSSGVGGGDNSGDGSNTSSSLSIACKSKSNANNVIKELVKDGGIIQIPIDTQWWGDYFGKCIDKYGTSWMVSSSSSSTSEYDAVEVGTSVSKNVVESLDHYHHQQVLWNDDNKRDANNNSKFSSEGMSSPSSSTRKSNVKACIYRKFNGNCEEAFSFYRRVFGCEYLWKTTWCAGAPPGTVLYKQDEFKIMHMGMLLTDDVKFMGCDEVPLVASSPYNDEDGTGGDNQDTSTSTAPVNVDDSDDIDETNTTATNLRRSKRRKTMQQGQQAKGGRRLFNAEPKKKMKKTTKPKNNKTSSSSSSKSFFPEANNVNMYIPVAAKSIQHANDIFHELTIEDGIIIQLPASVQSNTSSGGGGGGGGGCNYYFGMCIDRFGTKWMIEYSSN